MGDYEVLDGSRHLRFTGDLLGSATSQQPGKSRWTEHEIYRTEAGRYIVVTVGRSTVPGEQDRSRALVSNTPRGVIEALYQIDDDEVSFLTKIAREVIEEAADADQAMNDAWKVERVA